MPRVPFFLLAVLVLATVVGCGGGSPRDPYGSDATPADYAELRLTKTVNDERIKGELERLEATGQLPLQLDQSYLDKTDETTVPLIARFFEGTDPSYIEDQLANSGHLWDPNSPGRDLLITAQGEEFLKKWDVQRAAARNTLTQPSIRYPVDIKKGFLDDPTWTGVVQCLARAELVEAARQANDGHLSEAITAVAYAIAYGDQLNQVPILAARNTAKQIRAEAFLTMRGLLRHPQLEQGQLRTLESVLDQSLRAWPDDTLLWQVDRASGLHFLEMIRAGNLNSLLTREEYDAMRSSGELTMLASRIARNLTTDQAFYLDAMKTVVESTKLPYFERAETLYSISDALNQAQNSGIYPVISGDFLLDIMHAEHAELAADKARTTIWLTALQTANGHPPKPSPINEFSGKPIQVDDEPQKVVARFSGMPGDIPELVIPKLGKRDVTNTD
ncbi:hypothetical protein [Blastopirellula marina]|uniref:Uncharacterized protein n=1 Tax=Blastopirellula marina TaxID=124 RepID=A0A2S8GRM4_9BACT|nr:hypothetical protein [Blastopirellula marina]PQO47070.1 hypothetical protein C5Y93_06140 [Blastopirellula marina]